MSHGRLERILIKYGDVRGREARTALAFVIFFFMITATFYILKPVKLSILTHYGAHLWSYADLVTAGLIGFVVALNTRLLDRMPRRTYLTASLLFFAAGMFVFWQIFDIQLNQQFNTPVADSSGILFFLWAQTLILKAGVWPALVFSFWTDIFIAMSVTQFWIAVNDAFDAHQAKRLVGLFVTGGLFGGIAGSAVAALSTYAQLVKSNDLLLLAPVLLALALVAVNVVYAGPQRLEAAAGRAGPAARAGILGSFRAVRKNRYLALLAGMLASAMVVATLIGYQCNLVVKSAIEADQARTSFFGALFLVILIVSAVFHLAATRRVLKSYGIRWAIVIAPVALLAGSLAIFLIPAGLLLAWACTVRGGDKAFDSTISQSVRELLYVPVPADVKYKGKIFIDMFVSKFATGLGAVLFLTFMAVRRFAYRETATPEGALAVVRETAFLTLFFLLLWLALTRLVYRKYPAVLKKDIRRQWIDGQDEVSQHVDVDLTNKIFNTIQSRERSTTLYYMNVFSLVRQGSLTPELKELLGIKRDEIKARAMDALFDVGSGGTFYPGLEEALADEAFQKEIDLVFLLPAYQEIMAQRLGEIAGSASEEDRIEAANIISRMVPNESTLAALGRLLDDPSAEVVHYALSSAAVHRRPEHVPAVVRQLANPATRPEAQTTLAAYGPGVVDLVAPALRDDAAPLEVRRGVPEVLARLGTQRAADILLEELGRRNDDLEPALIEALYKVRAERPGVRFREKAVRSEVVFLVCKAGEIALGPPGPLDECRALLNIRIKRVFDLMTLLYPREDVIYAYQNILQGTARTADYSLESLDILLDRELKALLLPLVEDLPPEERALRLRKAMRLK
ncbi:MAG TPA: Npt1/Npt2 family nucleotide transporter [Acidobacteriota bacterium]|nr:Npt1/Npt2 family nucleotide transporter [Acidobacteriota bacterium]